MADLSTDIDQKSPGYGDLLMIDGDLVLTADVDGRGTNPIAQLILQRLRTYAGEYFMDTSIGVPWYQEVLGVAGAATRLDGILQNVVLTTPGVLQLSRWDVSTDNRRRVMSISFTAVTTSGAIDFNNAIDLAAGAI